MAALLFGFVAFSVTLGIACTGPNGVGVGGSAGNGGGAVGGAACSGDAASLKADVFQASCAVSGCHVGASAAAGLDLSGDIAAATVGVPSTTCPGRVLVVPGSVAESFLFEKLGASPSCGASMPIGGSLPAAQKTCVELWIDGLPPSDAGADASACELCGGSTCVDLQTDAAHCGSCTNACASGVCAAGACACSGGLEPCGGACVDTQSSTANCGACGKACPTGATCSGGACACPSGQKDCNGACVDTQSNAANCGACGKACTGGTVCAAGTCTTGCGALTQCGSSCVDTKTSSANCGACGNACPTGASCVAGACACPSGQKDCNGACVDTQSSATDCGTCGHACPAAETCQAGVCACPGGGTLCGSSCVDTQTSATNCGTCGNACAVGQTCTGGVCTCGTASVSFSGAVQPIFTASCASNGCHAGPNPAQGLSLVSGTSYGKLVNVAATECTDGRKRVLPGQPSQSYLVEKMMGVAMCSGTAMPKAGSLPSAKIQTIADWICAGAPNN